MKTTIVITLIILLISIITNIYYIFIGKSEQKTKDQKIFKSLLIALLIFAMLLLLSITYNIIYTIKINKLITYYSNFIDPVPSSYYYQKAKEAYEKRDWDAVTINAKQYQTKISVIKEEVNPAIYLKSSYALYKIFKQRQNSNSFSQDDYKYLELGTAELNKYLNLIKNNLNANFIHGLLLIEANTSDVDYKTKLEKSFSSFENSFDDQSTVIQKSNAFYHMGIAKYRLAVHYLKDKQCPEAMKMLDESTRYFNNSINLNSKQILKDIEKIRSHCKQKS